MPAVPSMARALAATCGLVIVPAAFLLVIPTEVQQPGTQPGEGPSLGDVGNCDNCHGGYDPAVEPMRHWRASMMSQAGRDPLFWATLAVAEQDFPGVGDLCLRCHAPRGWLEGRSSATDGSMLTNADADGVECALCHKLVNPDDSEWQGIQNPPFIANDGGTPPQGYYGSAMYVLWGDRDRLGPYSNHAARHAALPSSFHRQEELCATCHDVSNPVTGDLAQNNGAQTPLQPGTFSGVPGSPVTGKAAFNNFPFQYGVVERTSSEHAASLWPVTRVGSFQSLPAELQAGAVEEAYEQALLANRNGDYEDGTPRTFTCQSCHMLPVVGKGCDKNNAPLRRDLPMHAMTGGNYWLPQAIRWLDGQGRLRLGGGMSAAQLVALDLGKDNARATLEKAATLTVRGDRLRIVNLTGHKLISGYPEGRRMWVNIRWFDAAGSPLHEDGAYGTLAVQTPGAPAQVDTVLDLQGTNTHIYQAHMGMTREWADQLLGLGYPASLPLQFDRVTGATTLTLGQLAAQPAGTARETFHFALNNTVLADNRIPPWGFDRDEAARRNALPVPADQYGNPPAGGRYEHWDELDLQAPAGAAAAAIELLYQPTSWEYVQFLLLANDGSNAFLGSTGRDLLAAWRNTGMAAPHAMAGVRWCRMPGTGEDLELLSDVNAAGLDSTCSKRAQGGDTVRLQFRSPGGTFQDALAALVLQLHPTGTPPAVLPYPGIWLNRVDAQDTVLALTAAGRTTSLVLPPGLEHLTIRGQAIVLSTSAGNGTYAASNAMEIAVE